MTFSTGYALNRSDSLEELDMGGESKLLLPPDELFKGIWPD